MESGSARMELWILPSAAIIGNLNHDSQGHLLPQSLFPHLLLTSVTENHIIVTTKEDIQPIVLHSLSK